jgi:arylsulfatase A-like enzyme
MIRDLDDHVGRILATLDRLGLSERTLVVFSSDNGATHEGRNEPAFHIGGADPKFFNSTANLRGYKGSVYEGGIRVPMIARWPGKIPSGTVNPTASYFADWFPTLGEIAQADVPSGLSGVSLLPSLLQPTTPPTERPPMVWVFPEYGGQVAVRWDRWKLVRRELATRRPGPWELYDIEIDPSESENLATTQPERLSEGQSLLAREMQDNPVFPVRIPAEP